MGSSARTPSQTCATLLRAQLRLHIEMGGTARDVQTLTVFVGNNRLQLQQFGAEQDDTLAGTPGDGSMAALVLRPIGTLSMIGLTPVVDALDRLARQQRPDMLVLCDDITQRARPAQFREAGAPAPPLCTLHRCFRCGSRTLAPLARADAGVRQHHAGLAPQTWRDLRAAG